MMRLVASRTFTEEKGIFLISYCCQGYEKLRMGCALLSPIFQIAEWSIALLNLPYLCFFELVPKAFCHKMTPGVWLMLVSSILEIVAVEHDFIKFSCILS